MDADDIRPASPSTLHAIERLDADPDSPHLRIYRAVIKQDIRKLSPLEDETEDCEDKEDDGTDPREKIGIGKHPIEYYVYEVLAQKHEGSVRYFIFSAEYSMEDGDSKRWCEEEATRAEAIEHVAEASSWEDAEEMVEDPEGFKFPTEDEILGWLDEDEWLINRDGRSMGW